MRQEDQREPMLLSLLTRHFPTETIVFCEKKAEAHRLHIILGLMGLRSSELHGNLTQSQRLQALDRFAKKEVDIMLATDVAARGLDIKVGMGERVSRRERRQSPICTCRRTRPRTSIVWVVRRVRDMRVVR